MRARSPLSRGRVEGDPPADSSAFSSPTEMAKRLGPRVASPPRVRDPSGTRARSPSEDQVLQEIAQANHVMYIKKSPPSKVPGLSQKQLKQAMDMADTAIASASNVVEEATARLADAQNDAVIQAQLRLHQAQEFTNKLHNDAITTASDFVEQTSSKKASVQMAGHLSMMQAQKQLAEMSAAAGASIYEYATSPVTSPANRLLGASQKEFGEGVPGSPITTIAGDANLDNQSVAGSVRSRGTTSSSGSRRNLDLKHNDNAFHVVANLVLDRFRTKLTAGATSYSLTEEDIAHLDQMVPPSVRTSFVEAVRYRLVNNCPEGSTLHVHELTRQCQYFGLEREGDQNPLLATLSHSNSGITLTNLPPMSQADRFPSETRSAVAASAGGKHPVSSSAYAASAIGGPGMVSSNSPERFLVDRENKALRARGDAQTRHIHQQNQQLQETQDQRRPEKPPLHPVTSPVATYASHRFDDVSVAASSSHSRTGTTGTVADTQSTESLARQQLMAELREASNLMAESVTPEAAQFWKNHVVDLQSRLRALHSSQSQGISPSPTPDELAAANRRMMQHYQKSGTKHSSFNSTSSTPPVSSSRPNEPLGQKPDPSARSKAMAVDEPQKEQGLPMVDVVAPADLPGGYHFEAEIEGKRFLATVPSGGVRRGETFSCLMRSLETVGADIPVGRWRDRISDCVSYGICHPHFLNALFCPLLALGQVMTRAGLDVCGRRVEAKPRTTAWASMISVLIFWLLANVCIYGAYNFKWSENVPLSLADLAAVFVLNLAMIFFAIHATCTARASIREKYMIREYRCFDLEDCCCATFCMPCAICQMLRHTASYDHVGAACCTADGLVAIDEDKLGEMRHITAPDSNV